jgi:hypothetical protein
VPSRKTIVHNLLLDLVKLLTVIANFSRLDGALALEQNNTASANVPPALPPRNVPQVDREKQLKEEVEIGAQADRRVNIGT